jgi:hypothetical protein
MQPRSAAWCGDGVTDARYSDKATPEPLISSGRSLIFGKPSFNRSFVS